MGSLPFVLEASTESLVLLDTRSHHRHNRSLRLPPVRAFGLKGPSSGSFEHCKRGLLWWGSKRVVRAIGSGGGKSFGRDENEDGGSKNDVLEATLEKSKKVLALQRDLLQQIAERRKLVSSINSDSFTKSEGSSSSYEGSSNGRGHAVENKNGASSNGRGLAVKNQNGVVAATNGGFDKSKEDVRILPLETASSTPDFNGKLKEKQQEAIRRDSLPSTLKVENQGGVSQSCLKEEVTKESSEDEIPPPLAGTNVMNVILVAAECAPFSKTGGLGDVAGSLPKALAKRGHRVMVVAPRYGNYAEPQDTGVRKTYRVDGYDMEVRYFQAYIDGVDFVFIDSPMFHHLEHNIYGGSRLDILKRMVLFCKAAVEVPWHVPCGGVCYGDGNLAFIANDWHTALLPVYLKAYYRDQGLMKYARSVLVIHNIAHQGRGPVDDFFYVDLPEHYIDLFKLYDPIGGDHFNIFAAGLKAADRVVTVSHGYSRELKTCEGGWGLHGIINDNDWKLKGIVNGIDDRYWNPELDVHLKSEGYTNYSIDTLGTGKAQCKAALQKELGLAVRKEVPVVGFIGRLDRQKGVDLLAEAVPWMVGEDVQLIMLGSGRADLEQMLRNLEKQHGDKIRGWVGFSVKTAHRITAGADVLVMPSRFEPCGLNQLYAMRYGTVPVVHAVGGLRDTVQPFDPFNETGLGWTFEGADPGKLIHALGNCLFTFREYKKSWEGLQRRGMAQDLTWDNAALQYEEVLLAAKYQW